MRFVVIFFFIAAVSSASELVINGGFESGSLHGWTVSGSGTAIASQDDPHSGQYAAKIEGASLLEQTLSGLKPNTVYNVQLFIKCGSGSRAQFGVKDFGEKDILKKTTRHDYAEFTFEFTTGDSNTFATIYFGSDRSTGTILGDDISVRQALMPPAAGVTPNPPEGYKWAPVEELTDEFDGDQLDDTKWYDTHPAWGGRAPSAFKKGNAYVEDGLLLLRSTSRVDDLSEVADPMTDVWVDAAAVVSKKKIAQPGWFYEARFQASDLSMMSSFWFRMGQYSEIDVIEHIGNASDESKSYQEFEFACNTHVYGPDAGPSPVGQKWKMPTRGRDEFHNYGLWWKDPETLWFYHNGVKVMSVTPAVPFEEPLNLIFDTEVFTWLGLPTIESLNDPERNAMKVDWVRVWKLVEDDTQVEARDDQSPGEYRLLQNYPNPFNGSTAIEFDLPKESHVKLVVYNVRGQSVKRLIDENVQTGHHKVVWNGKDDSGRIAPSGVYFAVLGTESKVLTRKLSFVR